jgi:hypothetical protein
MAIQRSSTISDSDWKNTSNPSGTLRDDHISSSFHSNYILNF